MWKYIEADQVDFVRSVILVQIGFMGWYAVEDTGATAAESVAAMRKRRAHFRNELAQAQVRGTSMEGQQRT